MELLLIIFIAFFIAVLFSLLGLGGAIIYTPLFYWSGLPL
ncbi:MAG: sulfite exporter TauE/SafE family protein, partial [Candidatus Methanoperedens sp.]